MAWGVLAFRHPPLWAFHHLQNHPPTKASETERRARLTPTEFVPASAATLHPSRISQNGLKEKGPRTRGAEVEVGFAGVHLHPAKQLGQAGDENSIGALTKQTTPTSMTVPSIARVELP